MAKGNSLGWARRLASFWPLWISIGLLLGSTAVLYWLSLAGTQGRLFYPLDDTYLHMTLARNLAFHGNLGFSPRDFVFASSSPLFTLLIAIVFRVSGVHVAVPILLNLIFAVLLLGVSYFFFRRGSVPKPLTLFSLAATVILMPLPLLVLSGMEHVMQPFFAVVCLGLISALWDDGAISAPRQFAVGMAAFFATTTRYESVFLLVTACSLLWIRGRLRAARAVVIGLLLGIGLPGIYSVLHGGMFFPVSVLLKRNFPVLTIAGLLTFADQFLNTASGNIYLVVLLAAVLVGCYWAQQACGTFWNASTATGIVWIVACLLHLLFARIGWVFRYEAYMIAGGCFLLTANQEYIRRVEKAFASRLWIYPLGILILISIPFLGRTESAWGIYPAATANVHEQQYQMARFLQGNYRSGRVALNDIGVVSFYSTVRIFDIFGLGSPEVAHAKMAGTFDQARLAELSKAAGAQIAIAYEHWDLAPPGGLPVAWIKVGSWRIPNNVVCGSDTVSFFAINPDEVLRLRSALLQFTNLLPKGVIQDILPH